ncbi:o-succinylbenzoate--CoA ligase [soil metagenome]
MTLRPVGGPPAELLAELRHWWQRPDAPLVVRTSGSTGAPRAVQLSHRALRASATASQRRLGGPAVWVLALPVDFVAGLAVLVRSVLAWTEPVLLADHDGDWDAALSAARRPAAAEGVARCHTALVPTQLHRLAAAGRLGELAGLDTVLLGGAGADPDLVGAAHDHGVRVVTTYGMAETCGGCVYDGHPLDGVDVRVDGEGRVHVAGPMLFDGYLDDPAATARVLDGGWLRTDDLGRIDEGSRLHILGRTDEVVVSGGVNVWLPAVEQALRTHRGVGDAVVVGVGDAEWGSRVVAVVRPVDAKVPPTLADLRAHVAAAHPRSWAPRALVCVDRLPMLRSGKVDRVIALELARRTVARPA